MSFLFSIARFSYLLMASESLGAGAYTLNKTKVASLRQYSMQSIINIISVPECLRFLYAIILHIPQHLYKEFVRQKQLKHSLK